MSHAACDTRGTTPSSGLTSVVGHDAEKIQDAGEIQELVHAPADPSHSQDATRLRRDDIRIHQGADAGRVDCAHAREIDENPSLVATEKSLDLLTEFAVQRRLQGPLELKNRELRACLQ